MQDLSNRVLSYYLSNLNKLDFNKQFHFVSRLYLWNQNADAEDILGNLRAEFTDNDNYASALDKVITEAKASTFDPSMNASKLREPYFAKYPMLWVYVSALFRVTFVKSIYGVDLKDEFMKRFSISELEHFAGELLADRDAVAFLSTHAVNFFYLYRRLSGNTELFKAEDFWQIGQNKYLEEDSTHLLLKIYLYTHCIIGESGFYQHSIGSNAVYRGMIDELEKLISRHFVDINLDNKFEYLVCAKMLNLKSSLKDRIYEEAERSVSSDGDFLIDKLNNNPQTSRMNLNSSEHRNVLYIMSTLDYKPLEP